MQTLIIDSEHIAQAASEFSSAATLVVMPSTDQEMAKRAALLAASRAGENTSGIVLVVMDFARLGLVRIHNEVFKRSLAQHYAYLAQDVFVGRGWLSLGLAAMQSQGAKLLGFNDGKWMGQLASFGLVERAWAAQNYAGSLFFEGYKSHYADTELTLIARERDQYAYEPNAVVMEVDWDKDRSVKTNATDKRLFQVRAQTGFGSRVFREELKTLFA